LKTLVTIIGFGHVGRTLAFLLSASTTPFWVNIIDPVVNPGSFEDICHSYQGTGHKMVDNEHELTSQSEVIFHCAGPSVPRGADRLSVAAASLQLTESIFSSLEFAQTHPLVVVVANPVDLVCLRTWKASGLPAEQILGTGTLLDTRRFNGLLERELGLEAGASQAVVLGEHGHSMSLWTDNSFVEGRPILERVEFDILEKVLEKTKKAASFIKAYQGATYYGVAHCAVTLWGLYRGDEPCTVPASVLAPRDFRSNWSGRPFFLSLPVTLGKGQAHVPEVEYSDRDFASLKASADLLFEAWPGPYSSSR
jgi:malate/lactate dehydrogenase